MVRAPAAVERIVVRVPNWLGDALMARPLCFALRAAFPDSRMVALGPAGLVALLAGDDIWHDRVPLEPREEARTNIRAFHPDAVILCPISFSSAWFAWRCGAPIRVGFRGDLRDAWLTHPVDRPERGECHLAREYLGLGSVLGAADIGAIPALPIGPEAIEAAGTLSGRTPYAIVGPGAIYGPAKRWPVERFVDLAKQLAQRGWRVLACGAEGERLLCEEVASRAGRGVESVAGRTRLDVQAALCARAEVVVCNDSGLAHLSAAVGARTVSLFGSTSSAWTAPLGGRTRVVQHPPVCSPCFQRACRIGYGCLTAIAVRDVVRAIDSLLTSQQEVA